MSVWVYSYEGVYTHVHMHVKVKGQHLLSLLIYDPPCFTVVILRWVFH